jgi:hypothetical protein
VISSLPLAGNYVNYFMLAQLTQVEPWTTLYKDGTLRLSRRVKASRVGYFHEKINKNIKNIQFFSLILTM